MPLLIGTINEIDITVTGPSLQHQRLDTITNNTTTQTTLPPNMTETTPLHLHTTSRNLTEKSSTQNTHSNSSSEHNGTSKSESNDCLFCSYESSTLQNNMKHMSIAHSFTVPFQDFLTVDLETVIAYLRFVIYNYTECICCGSKRSTVEAIQHHMVDKGHCRFDIGKDTEDFYKMPQSRSVSPDKMGGDSFRLSSGKLVSNRKQPKTQLSRVPGRNHSEQALEQAFESINADSPVVVPSSVPSTEVARRNETPGGDGQLVRTPEALLAAQMMRLMVSDNRAQQRAQTYKRGRLEQANNTLLRKHFVVAAGDARFAKHL